MRRSERNCSPFECWLSACCLGTTTSCRQNGNVSRTQRPTTAAYSLWQEGRVERSSRRRRATRFSNIKWWVSVVGYENCSRAVPKSRWLGIPQPHEVFGQQMKVYGELREHGEVVFHSNVVDERDQLARCFTIQASAREVFGKTRRVGSDQKNRYFVCRQVDELLKCEDSTFRWESPSFESESANCH